MTPHINAKPGDYSNIVLMPGDPIRAKHLSEHLTDVVLVNDVRGCFGYTGYLNDKRISIQASGMGQPSIAIYANELFTFFNVDTIIRVGTCGAFNQNVNVGDIIFAMTSCSETNITTTKFYNDFVFSPCCDYDLLEKAVTAAKQNHVKYHVGSIVSIDNFYRDDKNWFRIMNDHSILGVDMETHMLYYLAMKHKKKALTINVVSDNLETGIEMSSHQRSLCINDIIKITSNLI